MNKESQLADDLTGWQVGERGILIDRDMAGDLANILINLGYVNKAWGEES